MTAVLATFSVRGATRLTDFSKAFKAIVDTRTALIDEEVRRAGFTKPAIIVNSREVKTYANTELFDRIQIAPPSPPVPDATRAALLVLLQSAPRLTGQYAANFLVLASGVPVTSIPARAGARSVFSIVNLMRYASPLEALLFVRTASVMYAASLQIRAQFLGAVKVSFSYRVPNTLPIAQRGTGSYPTAVPVIEIGGPLSNVNDSSKRPVSPRAMRRALAGADSWAAVRARQTGAR